MSVMTSPQLPLDLPPVTPSLPCKQCGHRLTDPQSRERRMGPVCARRAKERWQRAMSRLRYSQPVTSGPVSRVRRFRYNG